MFLQGLFFLFKLFYVLNRHVMGNAMFKKIMMPMGLSIVMFFHSTSLFAYYTKNRDIYDHDNKVVHMDGVNWAGFQDSDFVDELYGEIPFYALSHGLGVGVIDMLTHPWNMPGHTGISQETGVSFKTIRLPIQPKTLTEEAENRHFRFDLTDAAAPREGNGSFCARWDQRYCVQGLSVKESLYQLIQEFKNNEVRVLVDFHQTPAGRNGNVVTSGYTLKHYGESIATLADQLKSRHLDNVVGIDVFNEPHNLYWYQPNGGQPAWIDVIAKAADVVYEHNPDLLLFVEGPASESDPGTPIICMPMDMPVDANAYALSTHAACGADKYQVIFKSNWGENFKALLDKNQALQGRAVFDKEQFRQTLCSKTSADVCQWLLGDAGDENAVGHLVFSPHLYGKAVAQWQSTPLSSPYRFDWNFGFLHEANIPVVVGEAGFRPEEATDVSFFQESIVPYLQSHSLTHNLFYWTFNSNSYDTGGVREGASSARLVLEKEQALHDLYSGSF